MEPDNLAALAPHERSRFPVIVGRDREQTTLREALDAMLLGHGSLVLISGEAGIGKTSLVEVLAKEAIAHGCLVLTGHCYDLSTTPPYGPWLEITDRYRPSEDLPGLPEVLKRGTGVGDLSDQLALFEVARSFLIEVAANRSLVLVLEDLHWADQASLDLLRFVARQVKGHRLLLAVTYRDDEMTRYHPLFQLLPALVRESGAERLELKSLNRGDIRSMVVHRYELVRNDEDRLVSYLQAHAEGNPLYLRELLRTLEEEALLRSTADGWVLEDLCRVPVPTLVSQVIEGRVGRLNEETRRLLQIASIIGQEVPLDLWETVTAVTSEVLLSVVERAVEGHLLGEMRNGSKVRFTHALVREALYDSMLGFRRRSWHRHIAEALIASGNPDSDAVAHHLQQADDPRSVEWLVKSGERAQQSYAWAAAADRFEAAQSLLADNRADPLEGGWLLYRAGRLRRFSDTSRAIALLTEAAQIAQDVGDAVLGAYAQFDLGHVLLLGGSLRQGLVQMAAAAPVLDSLPPEHARMGTPIARWVADALPPEEGDTSEEDDSGAQLFAVNMRSGVLILWLAIAGRTAESLELGQRYVAQTARITQPSDALRSSIGDAHYGLGVAFALTGYVEEARQSFAHAMAHYRAIRHHRMIVTLAWQQLVSVLLPFRTDAIKERWRLVHEAEAAWQLDEIFGASSRAGAGVPILRIPLLALEGLRSGICRTDWTALEDIASRGQHFYLADKTVVVLGKLARERGEQAEAWSKVKSLFPNGPKTQPGDHYFAESAEAQRLAVALSLDAGDLVTARAWLDAHDRWLDWSGALLGRAEGLLLWGQFHFAESDVDRAHGYAQQALKQASNPEQPMALIAIHRFLGELVTVMRDLDSAQVHLQTSLDLADACAIPYERALTMLAFAELEVIRGNRQEARSLLNEVRRIFTQLGAKPTLERAARLMPKLGVRQVADTRFGLSPRELDVLRLLVKGKTNREIADELFISHHTVMRHVSHILSKLDVESRSAAVALAIHNNLV